MKRYHLLLTEKQLDHITTALFEWAGLCESEAENPNGGRRSTILPRVAREMDAVASSISKQRAKQGRLKNSRRRR